ncbi:MAG: HAD-IA family hydrolase [Methanotrichaceae archaeon]|nr:HAD-IA family hydrolase [Methanotrichaceae archaeon]
MIKAVVFDLDDTLYPEIEFVYSGYNAISQVVNKQLGIEIFDELVEQFKIGNRSDIFRQVLRNHSLHVNDSYIQYLVDVYRQHKPKLSPFPEVKDVLDKLELTHRLALISDGYSSVQKRKLDALELSHYFEVVIFSDDLGREFWKPHPRPYRECASRMSLDPNCMIYIADNPNKDFITPRFMGMKTIRVRRPETLHYALTNSPELEADFEVSSLETAREIIRDLFDTREKHVNSA